MAKKQTPAAKPVTKPVVKPAAKVVAKTAKKTAVKPAPKPLAKTAAKPLPNSGKSAASNKVAKKSSSKKIPVKTKIAAQLVAPLRQVPDRTPATPATKDVAPVSVPPVSPAPPVTQAADVPGTASLYGPTHRVEITLDTPATSHLQSEWLLTNGSGAYAMGTLPGVNTRRYHGLLVAATRPPVGRIVALNQMLEHLTLHHSPAATSAHEPTQTLELSSIMFQGERGHVLHPRGHELLQRFDKGLTARWTYTWGPLRVTRELFLHWKEQAATLQYRIDLPPNQGHSATLRLSPMLTLRDFHGMARNNSGAPIRVEERDEHIVVRRGELAVTLACPGGIWKVAEHAWWYNAFYPVDAERGQEATEDYFVPGGFAVTVPAGAKGDQQVISVTVALGDSPADEEGWPTDDRERHLVSVSLPPESEGAKRSATDPAVWRALALAADDFVVDRTIHHRELRTIMAGYPWFADWGRDTFIALPGIMLCTGRFDDARATLRLYAESIRDGLVPNRFDDYDERAAHYNTVDASLWFIRAALEYVRLADDAACFEDWLGEACMKIMSAYIKGTAGGIRMAGDGLITAGDWSTQLTWMDAAANGVVFTPRPGKAVEINALWYAALVGLSEKIRACPALDQTAADHYDRLADRVRRSFGKVFWDESRNYCADSVWSDQAASAVENGGNGQNPAQVDVTLRPNQIFAASLPVSPLPRTKQVQIVAAVRQHLLTPFGLRTLPPGDWRYHAHYYGPAFQRDEAYHQGTVWPWLIGPYAEAVLRCGEFSDDARREARAALQPLIDDLMGSGLGQLHEIHEADWPHRAVGTPAQAWSVAEVIRVLSLIES